MDAKSEQDLETCLPSEDCEDQSIDEDSRDTALLLEETCEDREKNYPTEGYLNLVTISESELTIGSATDDKDMLSDATLTDDSDLASETGSTIQNEGESSLTNQKHGDLICETSLTNEKQLEAKQTNENDTKDPNLTNEKELEAVTLTKLTNEKPVNYGAMNGVTSLLAGIHQRYTASKTLPATFRKRPYSLLDEVEEKEFAEEVPESSCRIALEILFPFLLASVDVAVAGVYLKRVESWQVFQNVPEVFILVPALLGLRGNIMMTLTSRLSTQANLGNMNSASAQVSMIAGNLAISQVQAVVVGLLASVAAMLLGWLPQQKFDVSQAFLLCVTSIVTACIACLTMSVLIITVVLLTLRCHANPDNVATSLATSVGDCATLALLSVVAHFFYDTLSSQVWIAPTVLCLLLFVTPLACIVAYRNHHVRQVLFTGWFSIVGGMMISSIGGTILDFTVQRYEEMANFQPLLNGVGGNLAAIQASRLSTSLHRRATPGYLPDDAPQSCPNPIKSFFGNRASARTARVLLLFVIPDHVIFMLGISYIMHLDTVTPLFPPIYLIGAFIQVLLLLYIADWLVHLVWKRGGDPDNVTSPFLTALADLFGSALLALTFFIVFGRPEI